MTFPKTSLVILSLVLFVSFSQAIGFSSANSNDRALYFSGNGLQNPDRSSHCFHGMNIQILVGIGMFNFPDFNTDYQINRNSPGYRNSLAVSFLPSIFTSRNFRFDIGANFFANTDEYSELNTQGEPIDLTERITHLKSGLNLGIGKYFHLNATQISLLLSTNSEVGISYRTYTNSKDAFYSFGIGIIPAVQFEFPLNSRIGLPLKIGYNLTQTSRLRRFIVLLDDEYWHDYIANNSKTQSFSGPFFMTGITLKKSKK